MRKSHNVTILIYHYVCPAKYRKTVFDPKVDEILKEICMEIEKRYEIKFLEIGTDKNHVHFLIQSVPMYSPTRIIQMVKSLTAREIFKKAPEVRIPVMSHTDSGACRTLRRGETLVKIIVPQVCDRVRNPRNFLWESPNKFSR